MQHSFDQQWFSVYKHLPWLSLFSTNNALLPSTFYARGNVSADCLADSTCCLKMLTRPSANTALQSNTADFVLAGET